MRTIKPSKAYLDGYKRAFEVSNTRALLSLRNAGVMILGNAYRNGNAETIAYCIDYLAGTDAGEMACKNKPWDNRAAIRAAKRAETS